jgi:hypothetical protein
VTSSSSPAAAVSHVDPRRFSFTTAAIFGPRFPVGTPSANHATDHGT